MILSSSGVPVFACGTIPVPDRVPDQFGDGLAGVRVVAQQVARPVAQADQGGADLGIGVAAGGHPAVRATPRLRAVVREHLSRRAKPRAAICPLGREVADHFVEGVHLVPAVQWPG